MQTNKRKISILFWLLVCSALIATIFSLWVYRQAILDWITVNAAYAGLIVFLISCLESLALVGILVPGMAIMLGIGTLVGLGAIPFWPTVMWATLGAITGDGLSFWLGRHYNQRLHHMWPLSRHPTLIPKGEQFFHKHGELSILFGRFVGPLRAIVPAVAGTMDMSPFRFYLMNITSATIWAPMVILPGAVFGASTQVASEVTLRLLMLVLALLLIVWFLVWLFHRLLRLSLDLVQLRFKVRARLLTFSAYILLILIAISTTAVFLTEKSAEIPAEFTQNKWWLNQWQLLADANPQFNVQYSGDLSVIRQLAALKGWYHPKPLSPDNVLQWLAPDAVIQDLPLYLGGVSASGKEWSVAFTADTVINKTPEKHAPGHEEVSDSKKSVYILSIKLNNKKIDAGQCLGFGRIRKLVYRPLFFGLGLPEISLATKIPASIVADIQSLNGLELAVHQHNKSDLLTIQSTETAQCIIKNI